MVIVIPCELACPWPVSGHDNEYFFLAEPLNLRSIPRPDGNGQLSQWNADGHGVVPRWCHCYRNSNASRLNCQFDDFHLGSGNAFYYCDLQRGFQFRLQQLIRSKSSSE